MGSQPEAGILSLQHQNLKSTQITTGGEKQLGCSLPEKDGQRCKEPFKGPVHKVSFAVTCLGFQQRWEQSGLEAPEERMRMEALGRELRD